MKQAQSRLQATASWVLTLTALASLRLMFNVGTNPGLVLGGLFAGWVLSPFVGLMAAIVLLEHKSRSLSAKLSILMVIIVGGSLAVYGMNALRPLTAKPAAVWLMVPLVSWVVIGISLLVATRGAKRQNVLE